MTDSGGKAVKVASPGTAVTVSGWKTIPTAGDEVIQGSEADIKKALSNRERQAAIELSIKDVDAINKARREERERREAEDAEEEGVIAAKQAEENKGPQIAKFIVKADVSGSAEAVTGALHGIGNEVAKSQVIHSSVGDVNESDIMTAKAAGGSPFPSLTAKTCTDAYSSEHRGVLRQAEQTYGDPRTSKQRSSLLIDHYLPPRRKCHGCRDRLVAQDYREQDIR